MLPTDKRLVSLSPFQEMWTYAHLKKHERRQYEKMYDLAKMVCSFINPTAAEAHFSVKPETIENTGFLDDIRKMDPKFKPDQYADLLE